MIVPAALSAAEVASLNAAIDRDRELHPADWVRGQPEGSLPTEVGGAPHRFQSVHILTTTDEFDLTLRHPSVWPLIQRLMGGDAAFDEVSVMVRAPCPDVATVASTTGGAPVHEQSWHRDHALADHDPDHPLALKNLSLVWYLDACDGESHAFSLVPESADSKKAVQRDAENINSISYDPIRETRGQGTAPEFPEQALKAGDESKRADPALEAVLRGEAIDCIGPSGTAVLMNTGSAHAGTARHTDRQRRTVHVYYGHEDRPPLSVHTTFPSRLLLGADAETQRFFSRQSPAE